MKDDIELEKEENGHNTETTVNTDENDIDEISFEETNEEGSRSEVGRRDPKLASEGSTQDGDDISFEDIDSDSLLTIKKLREKIKVLEKEKQDYMNGWQRANADYANLKKEGEERRKDDIRFASRRLIREILPVLDAYDLARGNKQAWEKVDQNWRIGIEYIFGQLVTVLDGEGAVQYAKEGDIFKPELHESIELVETEDKAKDGTIAQVLQSGYKMGDTILRVARVKVYEFREVNHE